MAENIQKVILTADNLTKAAFGAFRKDVTDADKSVLALEKSSQLLKTGLATLGVSLSGAAFAGMIKGVADAQDKLAKLSASTGIAVDTLAGLQFAAEQSGTSVERVGKAVTSFSRIVLESNGETDKYSRLIKALGLDLESLKNATPEQQFISLAGAIRDNVAEQDRAAAVTALLGSRYTELIPLLSQGEQGIRDMIARGKELNPVTKESAAAAELFNDKVDELTRQFNTFKVEAGNKVIPVLAEITAGMADAARQGGVFAGVLAGIKQAADKTFTSDAFLKIVEFSGPLGVVLADRVRAKKALEEIESQAKQTADALDDVKMPDIKTPPRSFVNILKDIDNESKKASASTKTVTKSLSEEEKQAQETARKIEQLTLKFDPLIAYNKELNELISLRASGLPDSVYSSAVAESIDKYTKATGGVADGISEIDEKTRQLEITTRQVFDTNEQIAINGIRGIQMTIADGLFNAARNGMDGMVMAVRDGLIRVAAEFASARLLKGSGIGALFGLESGSALASGGGGVSALNIASLGSSALNLAKGGFGFTSLAGNTALQLGQMTGIQSLTNFGAGAVNPALASFVTEGAGGFAASAGSAFSSFAGPAAIAAAVDIGLRAIFGDKKLGGTAGDVLGYVPIVGTLINGLFGRGAPKFQNEALVGNVSAGGFEGVLNQAFREKGGLARSDRVSNFIVDADSGNLLNQFGRLSESGNIPGALRDSATDPAVKRALEVGEFLDEAFGSIGDTLKETADKLGLSSDALNNFSAELDLVSEKGETLSEAQISEEITRISDAMIETLIPNLDELSKKGETSADTINRLNNQFSVLESAAMLFGNTAEQAAEKVRALGIDGQSAFIDSLGGVDVAAAEIQQFYDTVFTDAQKLDVVKAQILGILQPLGIDFVPTLEQLYDAVASGNPELIQAAFKVDVLVRDLNQLTTSLNGASKAANQLIDASTELPETLNYGLINAETAARQEAALRVAEKSARAERQKAEAEKFAAELDAIKAIKTEAESLRDTFLRSGDVAGAIMNELAIISESIQFTSAGAFNSGLAKQIADASQAVANRASENALRVPDVAGFMNAALGNIVSDSIVTPIYLSIRDAIVDGSGDMSNAVRDSVNGFAKTIAHEQARLSRAPRGQGIASVLSAQSDLSFVSTSGFAGGQKQFGRDVLAYGEAIRKLDDRLNDGQITANEYDGAIAGLNDVMGGAAKLFGDVELQFDRIKNSGLALASSGINAIGFYFNDITKQVAELNKQASTSGAAIAQTTDAIGRLKSASFVFGQSVGAVFSGNAAAGISFDGSPETDKAALIGQAAGIAAQVLTTADAARFAQQLAGEEAFSGLGPTGLRDVSLLLDGLQAFDPASFENAFLRINSALITGAVTQEQYNVLFNTTLDEFEGLGTSSGGAKSALGQLREAARNLADELLLGDKSILSVFQKTSEAQRQYNDVIERARSGNATSSELSGGVNNLLDAQLNSASTKFEFDRQFATVINDLQSIGQTAEDRRLAEQKKSTEELKAEIKQLRVDLNAANVAIAKSTAKTADVLDRWSVIGLPATET